MSEPAFPDIRIFADGADLERMAALAADPSIKGFTTNPTLMHRAGITDYEAFAREALRLIPDKPISFEVFSDELDDMEVQARHIAAWGANVYVKIPVTNTRREFAGPIIRRLSGDGVKVNVTAILTLDQVRAVTAELDEATPAVVSVFAGRIADTGRDPEPLMAEAVAILRTRPAAELLWASPRELLNLFTAAKVGCHIITVTPDILGKLAMVGKDLGELSLETVQMFYRDAEASGFSLAMD